MDVATRIYDHLQAACRLLEAEDDWGTAAVVSTAMDAVHRRWNVGTDHLPLPDDPDLPAAHD